MRQRRLLLTRRSTLAVVLAVGFSLIDVGSAEASVQCGSTITSNTTLRHNLACNGLSDAITITGNNISFDLNGFSITGPGGVTTAIGISDVSHNGVVIKNGTISGFYDGIKLNTVVDMVLKHVRVVHNLHNGVYVIGGSNGNTFRDVVAKRNGTDGIAIENAPGIQMSASLAKLNGRDGVHVEGASSTGITVETTTAKRNTSDGFFIASNAGPVLLDGDIANRNTDDGFDIESASSAIKNSTANYNDDYGIFAVPNVTDVGNNHATGNGGANCVNVNC